MTMSTYDQECIHEIGTAAGEIWQVLQREGTLTLARLTRELTCPRDVTMQAVGWLAREDKIDLQQTPRGRTISLR